MVGHYRTTLTGVGGWLAFLVVTLALSALGDAASSIWVLVHAGGRYPSAYAYLVVVAAIGLATGAGHGWLAWLLNARLVARTPRIVIAGLWLLATLPPLSIVAAAALMLDRSASGYGVFLNAGTVRPFAYAAVWTAYLLRSERIANTYAPAADDLAAVFH